MAFFGVNLWRLRRAIVGIRWAKRGVDVVCLGECQAEVGKRWSFSGREDGLLRSAVFLRYTFEGSGRALLRSWTRLCLVCAEILCAFRRNIN